MKKSLFISIIILASLMVFMACQPRTPAGQQEGAVQPDSTQPVDAAVVTTPEIAAPAATPDIAGGTPRQFDPATLNGVWVHSYLSDSVGSNITTTLTLNNGNYERTQGTGAHSLTFRQRGTFTATDSSITLRPTHLFGDGGALPSRWLTEAEVRAEGVHREEGVTEMFRVFTWTYGLTAIGLTVVQEGDRPITFTKSADAGGGGAGTGGGASGSGIHYPSVSATRLELGWNYHVGSITGARGTIQYFRVRLVENSLYIINWYDMDYSPGMGAWTDIEVGLINQTTGVYVQNFVNRTTERDNGFQYVVPRGGTGYYLIAVRLRVDDYDAGSFHLRIQG